MLAAVNVLLVAALEGAQHIPPSPRSSLPPLSHSPSPSPSTTTTTQFPPPSPYAVSPDSMTASAPSRTAIATSETSARVGVGFLIMLLRYSCDGV